MALDAEDLTDPARQVAVRRSSETSDDRADDADELLFDLEGHHRVAVQTQMEEAPWLDLVFDRPVRLRGLRVRNAVANQSESAGSIRVLAHRVDGATLLYDAATRARQLDHAVEEMLRHSLVETTVDQGQLARMLRDIVLGRFDGLRGQLKDLQGVTPPGRRQIRRAVNSTILGEQAREWNIHSVRRTFRYWQDDELRRYLEDANRLVDDLRPLSGAVCLGFGGVLGLVREGGLIGHDDDLDVIVAFEPDQAGTLAKGLGLVEEHLRPLGYTVSGEHLAHRFVTTGDRPKIDVFVGLFEGDTVSWFPGPRGALRRADVFPSLLAPLLEQEVAIPRIPTVYLEKVYGPRWRTPNPTYSHRWGRKPYEDIAGLRST